MANNYAPQGQLNLLNATVQVVDSPELNVTQGYFGKGQSSLSFEGEASGYYGTQTGAVPSPNPYQMVTLTIHLLKTQALSQTWEDQRQTNTSIGDVVVTTDAPNGLNAYSLTNCTIKNVNELDFGGTTPDFVVMIAGTYLINSSLFG